ncbi:hypothetical protein ACFLY1_00905 [Patescibacteria group bacterium]
MIKLQSGSVISNVVISTILEFGAGMFPYVLWKPYRNFMRAAKKSTTQFTKSFTALPYKGNVIKYNPLTWKYVRRIANNGMVNNYKHTNPGAAICISEIKKAHNQGFKSIIPNYYPDFSKEDEQMIKETDGVIRILIHELGSLFFALELKIFCPNIKQDLDQNVKSSVRLVSELRRLFPDLYLIIKVNYNHPYEFSEELENLGVGAIHAINTVNYETVFKSENPFGFTDCAVSGGPIKDLSLKYNAGLRKRIGTRILMGGGIMSLADAREFQDIGADAIVVCSIIARNPKEATKMINIFN